MNANETLLSVKNLRKKFGALKVLQGVDLEVKKGDVIAVIGPSGCGKSTLLRCLNLLETPTGGSIVFEGEYVFKNERAAIKKQMKACADKNSEEYASLKGEYDRLKAEEKRIEKTVNKSINKHRQTNTLWPTHIHNAINCCTNSSSGKHNIINQNNFFTVYTKIGSFFYFVACFFNIITV